MGVPVLLPSMLGGMLLLFGSAFAAYATAESLTLGLVPLSPIQIGDFLNGNAIAGRGQRRLRHRSWDAGDPGNHDDPL